MDAPKVTKIGFIGLGQMGKHIAKNLMGEDVELTVCDINQTQFASFREAGAKATADAQDLAGCELIFLCLPGDEAVKEVLTGGRGLLPRFTQGQMVVDLSTITYTATIELAAMLAEKGVAFLDAPVSGMEARAKDATLSVMAGGQASDFARIEPYLQRIGSKILHMGPVGSGQLT